MWPSASSRSNRCVVAWRTVSSTVGASSSRACREPAVAWWRSDRGAPAERQAQRTKKSRSQLYAEAIAEYLARHAPDEVTEAINAVVDRLQAPTDPFVVVASQRALRRS